MRVMTVLYTSLWLVCLDPITSFAQGGEQHRADEPAAEPYHKQHDTRHGHDHFYPDRGAIVRDLPKGAIGTSYAGVSYRYHDAIWLEPRGPAYMVVAPPIGLVAPTLPLYSTVVTHSGESLLYANETYYRPRPDLNGYEVINDPFSEPSAPAAPPDALVGGQLPPTAQSAAAQPAASQPQPAVLAGGVIAGAGTSASTAASIPAAAAPTIAGPTAQAETARFTTQGAAAPAAAPGAFSTAGATTSAAAAPNTALGGTAPAVGAAAIVPLGAPAASTQSAPKGPKVFLYPKNGQTSDQQARDRYDCYRFAIAQSGFDPMRSTPTTSGEAQSDYERAQSACFEARGYSSR
jgi:hypothetical protein